MAAKAFAREATYWGSAASVAQALAMPSTLPEVCFIGRSNCGKSSLINALLQRRSLVKTAKNPGHTQMLNFFKVGDSFTLVDMPGYGFGSRGEWGDLITGYWRQRTALRLACLLVDSRRGLMDVDLQVADLLEASSMPYQVVLTKADKLSGPQQAHLERQTRGHAVQARWRNCAPDVITVSAHSKLGLDRLRATVYAAATLPRPTAPG